MEALSLALSLSLNFTIEHECLLPSWDNEILLTIYAWSLQLIQILIPNEGKGRLQIWNRIMPNTFVWNTTCTWNLFLSHLHNDEECLLPSWDNEVLLNHLLEAFNWLKLSFKLKEKEHYTLLWNATYLRCRSNYWCYVFGLTKHRMARTSNFLVISMS